MAKLSTKDRNKLPASEFGIPDKRKFPLNDAAHVEDAARKVGYAQGADKKPLARKILSRARKYNLDTSGWKKVKLFAQEQVPPMSNGTSIGNAPPHTLAPYYEEDELMKRVKGLSNSNEAQTDVLTMARNIANRIHAKYVADQKPPIGNQNCQLCTWCAEANFRGINVLPRPIYSPRDPAFDVCAESIVMNPDRKEFLNFQELNDWIMTQPNARFYVHVKWNGGTGGHEFMLINFNIPHILDPQQGIFEPTTSLKIFNDYFGNIDYSESYICRLDDRPLNKALLTKMNSMTMLVPWDESKDIPYMREHGMLCDEDEQYLKDHGWITETSNPTKYTMRPAKESDLDFVYYSELETVDENKNDPKVQRYIKQDAKDSLGHTKIIVIDNNDIGVYQAYATNYWGVREGKRDWWYLAHIYIKPEYRSHGIGTEIIKNDISEHDKILLQVMKSNPRAKKLYESLGFVVSQENDHGGLVMRLDKSKTVQESSVDDHDYWEIDEEDGTFTTKLTSKILFAMSKLYYYWASIPESSWNIKSIDEFDIGNDDNWDMSVSAPEVWRDLLDETMIEIRGIIWVINDFDKLPEDRKKIHEGSFTFPHEELINVLTDIRDTAKNVYETNPLLKVKNLPYKIETPKDKKALDDIRSVGTLVMSVLKDWTNHYVPEKLKNAYRHGPYHELFTEGFIDTIQEGFVDTIQEQTWRVSRGNDFTYPFKCPDNMSVDEELMFEFISDIGFLKTISDDLVVPFCKKKGFEKEAEEALVRKANALGWGDGDYTDALDVINDFDHTSYGELALYPPSFGELVSDHEAYIIFDSSCDKPSTHIRVNITLDGQKFHAQIVSPEQVGPITITYDHSDEMFSGTREMVVNRIGRNKFINACEKKIMQLLPAELITFLKTINRGDCYTSAIKGFSEIWFYNVDDLAEIYLRDDFPYEHPDVKKLKRDGDWEKKLQILEKNQIKNIAICVGDFDDYPIYFKTATGELVNSIDNKVIAKSWKEFKSKIKPYTETVQEGAFQDIKNGVNPFSDNLVFHVTPDKYADGQVWEPRVPDYLDPYNPEETGFEDNTTPRICFSTSIEGCLNGITVNLPRYNPDQFDKLYVYIPEKPWKEYKHKTNKELVKNKLVYDANVTREVWIMEPVRMKLYGVIRVDQVSNAKRKSVVPTSKGEKDTRNYFTYKWHWVVKPRVLEKATKFDYSPEKVIDNLCIDLKKFKYGLIRNGRLMTGNVSDADYNKYWVYHSAQEVDEAGGGNCYDMVEYEANYLKSYGVPYKTYFMSFTTTTNKSINTHTICVVPYEGKFIYIEQAFKRVTDEWGHMRRRTFDTLNEIFQYVAECAADAEDKKQINFGVWDYTNENIDYGTPIQEFMKWIYTHTKMIYDGTAKPFKPTKEAYVPMKPSRFVLEGNDETITVGDIDLDEQDNDSDSDDDTTVEEKETTKTVTEKIETDNDDDESDYDVSNVDLGTFGSDTSDVQNEYDPKEIEILMKLMASEADAMNEYMDAAKDTNVDVLRRLYADIANEERFHMEQLLFAKSEITGEKYEPKDPDVKKEYEELLAMGMDEATAMSTAVDKFHIRGSVSEDDGDIDIDELKEDMTTVEMAMNFFSRNFDELMTVLESGTYDSAKTSQAVNVFMESFYMEDVAGPAASDINRGNWNQGPKGIIGALKKALGFILNMLGTIIRKFGNFLKKIKDIKKKYKTIHDVNGRTWKALFQDGVKFYFFNPKSASTGYIDADSLKKYSDIITHLTALCSKQVVGHYETSDISKNSLNELGTLRFDNIQKGIAIIERTNLQQIKYVIDESTSQMLDKLCFGTNNNANINGKTLSGKYDSATGEYRSFNVYNFLEDQSARWKKILEYENEVLDGFQNVKDQQLNTSAYRDAINGMKACIKGAKAFVNALSADLNQLMKINQIALDEMKKHDAEKTSEAKKGYDAKQDEARARAADELNVFGARSTINP